MPGVTMMLLRECVTALAPSEGGDGLLSRALWFAKSVLKKRKRKMNKHKHRKRLKKMKTANG